MPDKPSQSDIESTFEFIDQTTQLLVFPYYVVLNDLLDVVTENIDDFINENIASNYCDSEDQASILNISLMFSAVMSAVIFHMNFLKTVMPNFQSEDIKVPPDLETSYNIPNVYPDLLEITKNAAISEFRSILSSALYINMAKGEFISTYREVIGDEPSEYAYLMLSDLSQDFKTELAGFTYDNDQFMEELDNASGYFFKCAGDIGQDLNIPDDLETYVIADFFRRMLASRHVQDYGLMLFFSEMICESIADRIDT